MLLLVASVVITAPLSGIPAVDAAAVDTLYVDSRLKSDQSVSYDPVARTGGGGAATAYKTLNAAAQAASAGRTVLIRAGVYREQLKPANSGAPGKYITFRNYKSEKVTITGPALRPAIDISGRSHIVIAGLNVTNVRRWLHAVRSHHNIIRGNQFSKALDPGGSSKTGLFLQEASCNRIVGNTIEDSTQDNLSLIRSDRNIVANNTFRKARHTLWTIKGGSFNVLRNNFFHNQWQKIGEVYDCHDVGFNHEFFIYNCTKHNLIENNRFAYTPSSGKSSPYAGIQYAGQNGVIRNNVFYDTVGPALSMTLYGKEANFNTHNRVYNNVLHNTRYAGVSLSPSKSFSFSDNIFKNNVLTGSVFVANDTRWRWFTKELDGKPVQVLCGRLDGFVFQNNNVFGAGKDANYLITLGSRSPLVKSQQSLSKLQVDRPRLFSGNTQLDPGFVDEKKRDFHLKPTSRMIDRGAFLTRTTSSGNGNLLPVEDVGYFYDGYDIPGEKGDLIRLEGQRHTARVTDIDYDKKLLTLSQSLTWRKGQQVSLRYFGRQPDMGAYEFAPGGNQPPTAEFAGMPRANAPLTVDFDASASNDADGKVIKYDWDFGDGTTIAGGSAKPRHTYGKSGAYTASLKVTDNGKGSLTGEAMLTVHVGRPELSVKTKALDFGPVRKTASFTLANSGEGTLIYRISASSPWLSVGRSSGTCTTSENEIILLADRTDLKVGKHNATVTIDAGSGGRHEIAVTMEVPRIGRTKLIVVGDKWRYFKGTREPPKDWATVKFDDSKWLEGPSGIGFSSELIYATMLDDMRGNYSAVFMRRSFRIENTASVVRLHLGVKYDDGFIAYINGREVVRSRSMGPPGTRVALNRELPSKHDEEDPEEIYDIDADCGLLRPGENVLSIEFRNAWIKSSDACAVPRLEASVIGGKTASAGIRMPLLASLLGGTAVMISGLGLRWRRKRRSDPPGGLSGGAPNRKPWPLMKTLNWSAAAATAVGILVMSHLPSNVVNLGGSDTGLHGLAYGLLTLLLLCALGDSGPVFGFLILVDRRLGWIKISLVVVAVALFGGANEMVQPFFQRQGSMKDFLANLKGSGAVAGLWLAIGLVWWGIRRTPLFSVRQRQSQEPPVSGYVLANPDREPRSNP